MERAELAVETITIDIRKAEYILREHDVRTTDVAEVHANRPRYFIRSVPAGLYNMIGPNLRGRFLVAGIMHVVGDEWRLITAYWNTDGRAEEIYIEG